MSPSVSLIEVIITHTYFTSQDSTTKMDQNKKITDPEHHVCFYATLLFIVLY